MVVVYTGNGKGKTTAALGLTLREVGYKRKCLIIQFNKAWFTGELVGLKKLSPYVKIIQGGKGFVGILGDRKDISEHRKAAQKTFALLEKEILSGKWDVVVADEIIGSIVGNLITLQEVLNLVKNKPDGLDLVLTGRHAPKALIEVADLVTEMKEIKHPFKAGIMAKKGIDF